MSAFASALRSLSSKLLIVASLCTVFWVFCRRHSAGKVTEPAVFEWRAWLYLSTTRDLSPYGVSMDAHGLPKTQASGVAMISGLHNLKQMFRHRSMGVGRI